ncbi:DDE transposase [Flavivirga sp. 57AJ16]|uniref:DDE transposase n=1 Tax=Flavivirga sp. 57AJ16 TaxID=3025307 RepID=UPI0023653EF7|nr:DDE transposase [Flavivirga sp. 57AJ16]MDD7885485.1 DDE transposase [Flavivirga sp. 57AJ16]
MTFSEHFDAYYARFLESDLGKIHLAIPWDDLVKGFGLKESVKGAKMLFSPRGRIGLMFLKHYCCQSDKRLIDQLNSNIDYLFFCDMYLGLDRITNTKIVSQIRGELAEKLQMDKLQMLLASYWSALLNSKGQITVDATCYESELRYPTDTKLLWEAVHWLYKEIKGLCKFLGIKMPRSKYIKWAKRYTGYSKDRSKRKKKRKGITRGLLRLLKKFIAFEEELSRDHPQLAFTDHYQKRIKTIGKLYTQQYHWFYDGILPKDRIVSIAKDYIRPIKRGKEVKPIEWGAKVNKLQIDSISFIEYLSFDNFNEGTRLKNTVYKAQQLTKTKVRVLGGDGIYATNANRKFIT